VLAGRDLLGAAQTGTGKTAGFTLPILQILNAKGPGRNVRALVLVPTRELAAQVLESVRTYGKNVHLRAAAIFGGVNINPQIRSLRKGMDILVATPGRLLDHVRQQNVNLSRVEVLVLDEADRMLDMGFIRDIRQIISLLPARRQNLLFSATFSSEIRTLAAQLLHKPTEVSVAARNAAADTVNQVVYPIEQDRKRALLSYLVGNGNWKQVLVFSRTKHGADRLARQLEQDGIRSAALHGNKSQGARTRALADFKAGQVAVLVATDIAARGLDIDQLPHVVNYELPHVPEDYVHRIGRTGRAGATGEALSLVSRDEAGQLADIERLLKRELPRVTATGFEPGFTLSTAAARSGGRPAHHAHQQSKRPNHAQGQERRGDNRPGRPAGPRTGTRNIGERSSTLRAPRV